MKSFLKGFKDKRLILVALIIGGLVFGVHNFLMEKGINTFTVGRTDVAYASVTPDYYCEGIDDDIQFQLALNALPVSGGEIRVLAGTYVFTHQVSRAINDVTFTGVGDASYITFDNATAPVSAGVRHGWKFQNIRVDAGGFDTSAATNWTKINTTENGLHTTLSGDLISMVGDITEDGNVNIQGNVTISAITGLLKANVGLVSIATGGVDYEFPLSFNWPLSRIGNAIFSASGAGSLTFTYPLVSLANVVHVETGDLTVGPYLNLVNGTNALLGSGASISLHSSVVANLVNDTNIAGIISSNTLTFNWLGTLGISRGGTNLSTLGAIGQVLAVNGAGTGLEYINPSAMAVNHATLSNLSYATANHTGFQASLSFGSLTETGSSILTINGGTNAVIGAGTTINISQANSTTSGYLSFTDWSVFNSKLDVISGLNHATLGNLTYALSGHTGFEPTVIKGNLTELTSNVINIIGGTNAVIGAGTTLTIAEANSTTSGYLNFSDWNYFDNKESFLTFSLPLERSGNNIFIWQANATTDGYLTFNDWNTFNNKLDSISGLNHATLGNLTYATAGHSGFEPTVTKGDLSELSSSIFIINGGTGAVIGSGTTIYVKQSNATTNGYLSSTDWSTFNSKENVLAFNSPLNRVSNNVYLPTGSLTVGTGLTITNGTNALISAGAKIELGTNVVTSITNDTNIQGFIGSNNLTLVWNGLLDTSRIDLGTIAHNSLDNLGWAVSGHNDINFNVDLNGDDRVGIGTSNPAITLSAQNKIGITVSSINPLPSFMFQSTVAAGANNDFGNAFQEWIIGEAAIPGWYTVNGFQIIHFIPGVSFTSPFRIDPATDYIGIGSVLGIFPTPDRRLDILDASNPQLRLTYTDNSVYTDFQTTSSGHLYINPSGSRVGVGTSSPDKLLHIYGSSSGSIIYALKLENRDPAQILNTAVGILFEVGDVGGSRGKGSLIYSLTSAGWNRGDFYFLQNSLGNSDNPTLADIVMVIKNNGYVGFGNMTTAPARISLVAGTTAADGIDFGGDVNLYRFAPNVLVTDDGLIVAGGLAVTSNTIDAYGTLDMRSNLRIVNKVVSGWLNFATRDTSGSEVVMNLDYVGSLHLVGNSSLDYANLKKSSTGLSIYMNATEMLKLNNNGNLSVLTNTTWLPSVDNNWSIGSESLRLTSVRAVSVVSGDMCFEDYKDPVTGTEFVVGDTLALIVTNIEEKEIQTLVGYNTEIVTKTRWITQNVYTETITKTPVAKYNSKSASWEVVYEDTVTKTPVMMNEVYHYAGLVNGTTDKYEVLTGTKEVNQTELVEETYTETVQVPIYKTEIVHTVHTVPLLTSTASSFNWETIKEKLELATRGNQ